ncbi:MAG: 50S ribosomal protein L17 [Clostridiales bacterium]|nr:50S ribosomal protein L17 [Clostridiales bacterium]
MATERKLGRTESQRKAMLRNLTTNLLWYGRIETTEAKAKEVRSIVDKMITLAIREYDQTVEVEKEFYNNKKQIVKETFVNDLPSKLHARRLMMAYLYDVKEAKKDDENKADYKERTKDNKHPVVEKLFREYGPKYRARNQEKNCAGGYTKMYKLGPRRGDAAEMVIIELV